MIRNIHRLSIFATFGAIVALLFTVACQSSLHEIRVKPATAKSERELLTRAQQGSAYRLDNGDEIEVKIFPDFNNPEQMQAAAYKLEVGDIVEIHFFRNWQFNINRTVRPDGCITVPYVGDLYVKGLVPTEIAKRIEAKYKELVIEPGVTVNLYYASDKPQKEIETTVTVLPDGSVSLPRAGSLKARGLTLVELETAIGQGLQKIYSNPYRASLLLKKVANAKVCVVGEVQLPGVYPLDGSTTVQGAIALAHGVRETANLGRVIVVRRMPNDTPLVICTNLNSVYKGRVDWDFKLQPYDIVFVPKTAIAKIKKFLDQHLFDIFHYSTNLGFYYILNPQTSTQVMVKEGVQ